MYILDMYVDIYRVQYAGTYLVGASGESVWMVIYCSALAAMGCVSCSNF